MSYMSYKPMNGGIGNQTLALLGLVRRCISNKYNFAFPDIVDFTPGLHTPKLRPFCHAFSQEKFINFLHLYNIQVCEGASDNDPWPFFVSGARFLEQLNKLSIEDIKFTAAFINALYPHRFRSIIEQITSHQFEAVVQLRVENDWVRYTESRLKERILSDEQILLDPFEIVSRYHERFPASHSIYICVDHNNISFDIQELKEYCSREFNLSISYKKDFVDDEEILNSNLAMSVIDMQVAAGVDMFVGTSRSTFSNLACLMGSIRNISKRQDFIYNTRDGNLATRGDLGTFASPLDATGSKLLLWCQQTQALT